MNKATISVSPNEVRNVEFTNLKNTQENKVETLSLAFKITDTDQLKLLSLINHMSNDDQILIYNALNQQPQKFDQNLNHIDVLLNRNFDPVYIANFILNPYDQTNCSIAFLNFTPENVMIVAPCYHYFSKELIEEALNRTANQCPICRQTIKAISGNPEFFKVSEINDKSSFSLNSYDPGLSSADLLRIEENQRLCCCVTYGLSYFLFGLFSPQNS